MIDLNSAKRIDRSSTGVAIYIFECKSGCGSEIKVYKQWKDSTSGYCKSCSAKMRRKDWTIREQDIIRVENVKCKTQVQQVWVLPCSECGSEIRVWSGARRTATGKCRICVNRKYPFRHLYTVLKLNAKYRNIPCDLTFLEFLEFTQVTSCFYCFNSIKWNEYSEGGKQSLPYNLDRIDNLNGYTIDNCVVCCGTCNLTRGDRFSFEEFKLFSPILKKIMKTRQDECIQSNCLDFGRLSS